MKARRVSLRVTGCWGESLRRKLVRLRPPRGRLEGAKRCPVRMWCPFDWCLSGAKAARARSCLWPSPAGRCLARFCWCSKDQPRTVQPCTQPGTQPCTEGAEEFLVRLSSHGLLRLSGAEAAHVRCWLGPCPAERCLAGCRGISKDQALKDQHSTS